MTYTAALSAPSHEEIYWIYKSKGLQGAESAVKAAEKSSNGAVFQESRIITIAKELGYSNKEQESLDMFRLTAFAFPDSTTAQLAAGEALLDAGLKDEARPIFNRVLQLDPGNKAAKDSLGKLGG